MELQVIKQSICDLGREFRHYQLCVEMSKELKGLNQRILLDAMQQDKFEEAILTFGQQAVTDAPEAMQQYLTPQTYEKLCNEYKTLKNKTHE